jgi:hypothetical protein
MWDDGLYEDVFYGVLILINYRGSLGAFVLEYIHWTVSFTINAAAHAISVFYMKATSGDLL